MTKLVVMSDHSWIALKIRSLIFSENEILRKAIRNIRDKICNFETKYGTSDPESLCGQADDMEIIEWEGEIETEKKLQAKLNTFEEIVFEYQ